MFNEVFLTDADGATTPTASATSNDGWSVANTTLALRALRAWAPGRSGPTARRVRPGRHGRPATSTARAGDFVRPAPPPGGRGGTGAPGPSPAQHYIDLARALGRTDDPAIRQRLAQAHILGEIRRMTTERHKAVRAAGGDIPGIANFASC